MIYTSEQVSRANRNKLCDLLADAIVSDCLKHDRQSRVDITCMIKNDNIIIAGEIASLYKPDCCIIMSKLLQRLHVRKEFGVINLKTLTTKPNSILATDGGIVHGYATRETEAFLPLPFVVATRFIERLGKSNHSIFGQDARARVSYDYDTGRITNFVCYVQHSPAYDVRQTIEILMNMVALEFGLNTDFQKFVNPGGRLVTATSKVGATGRLLACDTYGGFGHVGNIVLSGKDPSHIERSGTYMARKIAVDLVRAGCCDKCEVQMTYVGGKAEPIDVSVETFGTSRVHPDFYEKHIRASYDLTRDGIVKRLNLLDVDYDTIAYGGHFGKKFLPWE